MPLSSCGRSAILLTFVAALIAFSAVSCGNDDDADSAASSTGERGTPTAPGGAGPTDPELSATPSLDTATLDVLEQSVLAESDVPQGLVALGSIVSTNEDVASAAADPEAQLAQLETWQRILGLEVTFLLTPAAPADIAIRSVTSAASIYGSPDTASESYQAAVEEAEGLDWQLQYSNLDEVRVETMDANGLGSDETYWVRISGLREDSTSIDDYVLMRSGVMRLFVRAVSIGALEDGRSDNIETIRGLAQAQVQRALTVVEDL